MSTALPEAAGTGGIAQVRRLPAAGRWARRCRWGGLPGAVEPNRKTVRHFINNQDRIAFNVGTMCKSGGGQDPQARQPACATGSRRELVQR